MTFGRFAGAAVYSANPSHKRSAIVTRTFMKTDEDLCQSLARFLGAFQLVFGDEWDYSREMLEREMAYAVSKDGTFINPGQGYERKNWGARTALLKSHAELLEVMKANGLSPEIPTRDNWFNYNWGGQPP